MDDAKLRTLQIVCVGLILGVASFAAVLFLLRPPTGWAFDPVAAAGILAGLLAVILAFFLPRLLTSALERRLQGQAASGPALEAALHQGFASQLVVAAALLEAGCLLNLVLSFLTPSYFFYLVPLVLLGLLALKIPTAGSVDRWLAARREAITGRRS